MPVFDVPVIHILIHIGGVGMANVDRITQLLAKMDVLREQLNKALDTANGNQQDPSVQKIANEFDKTLNEYMRAMKH